MKSTKFEGHNVRQILIGCITNDQILARIAAKNLDNPFTRQSANLIYYWCKLHFEKRGEAPKHHIFNYFSAWEGRKHNREIVSQIEVILESLSHDSDKLAPLNVDFIVDLASGQFNRDKIQKLIESAQSHLDSGKTSDAVEVMDSWSKIELGSFSRIDPIRDEDVILETFSQQDADTLIDFSGDLGRFFGDLLSRESFVSFVGPDKTGKSFWLNEIVYLALRGRKRVVYFEVGDMSRRQTLRRLYSRISGVPFKSPQNKWPLEVKYPIAINDAKGGETVSDRFPTASYKIKKFDRALDSKTTVEACQKLIATHIKSDDSYFHFECHPTGTISVKNIDETLSTRSQEGWSPDVIVIDYADILAPIRHRKDDRAQINETWQALRSLSLKFHCLVVTATQSNSAAYKTDTLSRDHFSEDKRKNAHVTAMVAINMAPVEKERQLSRLGIVLARDSASNWMQNITVAQCLPLARPAVLSKYCTKG